MPTIIAQVQAAPVTTQTEDPKVRARRLAQQAVQGRQEKTPSALAQGDDFSKVRKVEHELINIGVTVNNAIQGANKVGVGITGKQPFPPLVPYDNVLGSMKGAAKSQAITSIIRNGIAVAMKKETLSQAGGRVAGDVSVAAIDAGASAVVGNIAMGVAAAVGASSLPVLLVGMVAGYVTTKILDKKVNYKPGGVYEKVVTKTTEALQKLGVK